MRKSRKSWTTPKEHEASLETTNLLQEMSLKTTEEETRTRMFLLGVTANPKRDLHLSKELTLPTNNQGATHNHKRDTQEKQCPQKILNP